MELLVIILSGLFLLVLLIYLIHLSAVTRLTKQKKRYEMGLDSCIVKRQKAKRRNSLLGALLVISAMALLGCSYYALFTEGITGATVDQKEAVKPKAQSKNKTTSSTSVSESSQSNSKETTESSSKKETGTSDSAKLAKEKAEKEAAEAQKKADEEKKQEDDKLTEESKLLAAEEEEGDGLPISLEGSFDTDGQGVATVTGKVKGGIKKLSVTNSVNDQEQQVDVKSDGTFSFNYTMANPMATVTLFVCDASQVGSIPQEDRQQTSISANPDYLMAYQEQQNAKNEQEYD